MQFETEKETPVDVYEYCPHCEQEVVLKTAFLRIPQPCPNCQKLIYPCTLCNGSCHSGCAWKYINQ